MSYKKYGKLMIIVCCASHAILAAVASEGPTPDIDQLRGVVAERVPSVSHGHMVLDAGFDSADNHRLLREEHGILSTIPPEHGRPPKDADALPPDKYRRMMKRRFGRKVNGRRQKWPKVYGKRAQVETAHSMLKRNLGESLRGRSDPSRRRDMLSKVLTHNCMLALLWVFYKALPSLFLRPKVQNRPLVGS